jgi:NAD(P)-dependent dehydrogenase (short-subunit alcohol dehydrogenase family)
MEDKMTEVDTRHAVVTGSSSGIGAAVAERLLKAGWRVTGWDRKPSSTPDVEHHEVNVADAEAVQAAAENVTGCDLLVNSAGVGGISDSAEMSAAAWNRVVGVNLSGTFFCCQALFPALKASSGLIVNLASIMAHQAEPRRAAYCASKAGVVMLTEVLGVEWAPQGVRTVAISPGYVRTALVDQGFRNGNLDEGLIESRTPLGRLADPGEVAELVHVLASGTLSYLTASTIRFDGGWVAGGGFPRTKQGDNA